MEDLSTHYVSWYDFFNFLNHPNDAYKVAANDLIRTRIAAHHIESVAAHHGYSQRQIFVNVIPIIIGAGSECITALEPYIQTNSVEAEHFLYHFKEVAVAQFQEPEYLELGRKTFAA